MTWLKRFWQWLKSLFGKMEQVSLPFQSVEKFHMDVKPPAKKKLSITGRKQKKQRKSTKPKHRFHAERFGTFRPRKPLPKFIFVGLNRQNSIEHYRKVVK